MHLYTRRTLGLLVASMFAAGAHAQPTSTDLGTLTLGTPVNVSVPTITAGNVEWYRFTLASPVSYESLRYLQVTNTNGTGAGGSDNAEVALFNSVGQRMAADDDDGLGNTCLLTFGTGSGVLPAGTSPTVSNGRDGDLPAGAYYLGVAHNSVAFSTTGWGASFGTPLDLYAHSMTILAANTTPTAPAVFTDLGTLPRSGALNGNEPLAAGEVRWFKVVLPDAVNANLTYVDIDTENTSLSAANATRMTMYGPNGAVQSTAVSALSDLNDGSGSLSQLTFGQTTPARPAIGDGQPYNGRDGTLRAGTYYIAVSSTPSTTPNLTSAVSTNFGAASTSTNTGNVAINLASGATQTSPSGTVTVSTPFAAIGESITIACTVLPGANPTSTSITVAVDGGPLDAGSINLLDNGVAPDAIAGDGIYTRSVVIGPSATSGASSLATIIGDLEGRTTPGTVNFFVVGPAPACPTANETFTFTSLTSEGGLNAAENTVVTFDATGTYDVGGIYLTGRFVANNAFNSNARVRVTSPAGSFVDLIPFTANGPSGVPTDADVNVQVPCNGLTAAGTWTVRIYETINDGEVPDGVWGNLCIGLASGDAIADRWTDDACIADSGDLPASAQVPVGSGPLNTIVGAMTSGADVDMFKIDICDINTFTASTVGGTTADSQLWLFNLDGTGVMHNDDWGGGGLQSRLHNTTGILTTPGEYYLAISGYNRDAIDANSARLFPDTPFTTLHVPTNFNPIVGWTGTGGTWTYAIALTGVCFPGGGGGGCDPGCSIADLTFSGGTLEEPGCPDGQLTLEDILVFIDAYNDATGCPGAAPCNLADITWSGGTLEDPGDPDGQLTLEDILLFTDAYNAGCN